MKYPHIPPHITKEELIEHFTLYQEERFLLSQQRKDETILGFAVLLKAYLFLGYPPYRKEDIPTSVVSWISEQLKQDVSGFSKYLWKEKIWKIHLTLIRQFYGFRPFVTDDYTSLSQWFIEHSDDYSTEQHLSDAVIRRCRHLRLELPSEKEFARFLNSVWQQKFEILCQKIADRINPETKEKMELCLSSTSSKATRYDWMKSHPGPMGMKTVLDEVKKLNFINEFDIKSESHLKDISLDMLKLIRERARPEDAYQMKRHNPSVRYALLAVLLHFRRMEVTDTIVKIFLELIHRIDKKTDKSLEEAVTQDIRKVFGKREILYKVSKAATEKPDGSVREVIFSQIGEDVFRRLIEEFEGQELSYENSRAKVKKRKYKGFYRRMMQPVLDTLVFRANNPAYKPLLDGLTLVKKYVDTKYVSYPDETVIPPELLTGEWQELAGKDEKGSSRVFKHDFELCVLQKLEKALKWKEVWVETSYRYRNPDHDLPKDWSEKRVRYCTKHNIPAQARDFVEPIKEEMKTALKEANEFFSQKRDVYIYRIGSGERGFFRIPKIHKRPDRPLLQDIKKMIVDRWGILDLVDILLEADRSVDFSQFFYTTGQRHVLSQDEIKERLLLSFLGRGTGMGLKRIHSAARPSFSYDDLLYFNKRFVHIDSIREALTALVNRILEVRNPTIWGTTTACVSDGKYFGAWDQNIVADFNPHYHKRGIMSYWHVDTNSACIHSQIKSGISEVTAMIIGLIRHDTEMRVESNFVDSHGQSELAFTFCRFLAVDLLPRLKRMKYARLFLPDKETAPLFPHLASVLDRPIRWETVYQQYDEMVRHVVAAREGIAPIDSILRRFNTYNRSNPTYKAFVEAGKALKTIHLCNFLTQSTLRHEIHEGLNIVESWNAANDFLLYAGRSEIPTNDPETQEITVLCLHLLQNAIILVNTLMLESVLFDDQFFPRMKSEDLGALTPLFTSNVNPYGDICLDLHKPSFLLQGVLA